MTTCQKCRLVIGDLETPYEWQGYTICINCAQSVQTAPAPETPAYTAPDPLAELASQNAAPPAYSSPRRHRPAQRGQSHPLVKAGGLLMLISIPFFCLFFPIAFGLLFVGLVLLIVGSCL
jgi:hypothetical protein